MVRSQALEVSAVRRAQIALLAADGVRNREIAAAVGIEGIQVGRKRERFVHGGVEAIEDDPPRSGRKPRVDRAEIAHGWGRAIQRAPIHRSRRAPTDGSPRDIHPTAATCQPF